VPLSHFLPLLPLTPLTLLLPLLPLSLLLYLTGSPRKGDNLFTNYRHPLLTTTTAISLPAHPSPPLPPRFHRPSRQHDFPSSSPRLLDRVLLSPRLSVPSLPSKTLPRASFGPMPPPRPRAAFSPQHQRDSSLSKKPFAAGPERLQVDTFILMPLLSILSILLIPIPVSCPYDPQFPTKPADYHNCNTPI
jgi:hypothetical protein